MEPTSAKTAPLEIRALADGVKLSTAPQASAAIGGGGGAILWTPLKLIIAAISTVCVAVALGVGLGVGLKTTTTSVSSSTSSSSSSSSSKTFDFKGAHSLATVQSRSGRRLSSSVASNILLAVTSTGNSSNTTVVTQAANSIVREVYASPGNATILRYWNNAGLTIGTVSCFIVYVSFDGVPTCIQNDTSTDCPIITNMNKYLPTIQFSSAGNVYYECSTQIGAKSIKMFSNATQSSVVVIPAPSSQYVGYRVSSWAVADDGNVVVGLQDQSTFVAKGITALYYANGSSTTLYSDDLATYFLRIPSGLFVGYLANGLYLGGFKRLDSNNITGFASTPPFLGWSSNNPSYAWQTVMPLVASGGVTFYAWATLKSGHTIAATYYNSNGVTSLKGTTAEAYSLINSPYADAMVEYYPQPQTLTKPPFAAVIAIIPAAGATAAIAGLDTSGACLVSLYNRTSDSYTTLLSQNTSRICIQIVTYSETANAIVYSGIYNSTNGTTSIAVGTVSLSTFTVEAQDVSSYSTVSTLTSIK